MSLFYPLKQTTLHISDTGPEHDKSRGHLFVVLTSPDKNKQVLCVSVCSAYPKCDTTCLLVPGDHAFIKHDSFVLYAKPVLFGVDVLCKRVNDGTCEYLGLIDAKIHERICDGLLDSPLSLPWAMSYLNENG